jgi:hypothetical protein
MITTNEIAEIMEITTVQVMRARENAVSQDRFRLRKALSAEIQANLDPEWNYAMRRALEILDSDTVIMHPVLSAEEVKQFSEQVAQKMARLVPNHNA